MRKFKGAEVAPVEEMLERTLYGQAKNAEIVRLTEERDELQRQLEATQRWQPVEEGDSIPVDCPAPVTITERRITVGNVTIVFSDNYRLCRLV